MLSTILHPGYLFVKKEDLQTSSVKRFVENLLRVKKVIEDVDEAKVIFSKNLWLKISTDAPWSKIHENNFPKQYTMSIQAIIFPFLTSSDNVTMISEENISRVGPCNSIPELTFFMANILDETKRIISFSAETGRSVFIKNNEKDYNFFYKDKKLDVKLLNSPETLYQHVNYKNLWPKKSNEINKFHHCLKVYRLRHNKEFLYEPIVTTKFLNSFIKEERLNKKTAIIDRIGMRLTMTQSEAEKTPLKEHKFTNARKGGREEYRINVDAASRVNYLFKGEKTIEFNLYTASGKHDLLLQSKTKGFRKR